MEKNKFKVYIFSVFLMIGSIIFLSGCYYTFTGMQNLGLKTIKIANVENQTGQPELDLLFIDSLIEYVEYYTDIKVVSDEANAEFYVTIPQKDGYIFDPTTGYEIDDDKEESKIHKITIKVKVTLDGYDNIENQKKTIWTGNIMESISYDLENKDVKELELEKQKELIKKLAEKVVIKIFEGW